MLYFNHSLFLQFLFTGMKLLINNNKFTNNFKIYQTKYVSLNNTEYFP